MPLGPVPAGLDTRINVNVSSTVFSVEYIWKNFTAAAEYWMRDIDSFIAFSNSTIEVESGGWYGSISYRFTDWLEAGFYYSVYYQDKKTARFDINDYWLVKLEGHMMNGAADMLVLESDNPDGFEEDWFLFAAKVTFNF